MNHCFHLCFEFLGSGFEVNTVYFVYISFSISTRFRHFTMPRLLAADKINANEKSFFFICFHVVFQPFILNRNLIFQ